MDYRAIARSRLLRFVLTRLALGVVTAFCVSAIVFVAIHKIPGDPAFNLLGTNSTPQQRANLRQVMGLNKSLVDQFGIWFVHLLHGDLGFSYSQNLAVTAVISSSLGNTLLLGGSASVLAIVIGLVMGNLGTAPWRVVRRVTDWFEAIFLSAPQYTVALILLIVFAVLIPIFPAGGLQSGGGVPFSALVLPAVALALAPGAQVARSLKTSLATLQATELLPALKGRGLSPGRIAVHAHHNALPPMITVLGIQVGGMLGGALFVESIFSIPGLGNLVVQSVQLRDYQLVQGVALVIALLFVTVLFISDLLNALLDPRIRVGAV